MSIVRDVQRVELDRADYYELQTLFLRRQMALTEASRAQAALTKKFDALGEAKRFDPADDWVFDDSTCSLVAKGQRE